MVSVVKNFVTVRKTRGDVLRADEYRTIVEMIKGILKNYKFLELSQNYKAFVDHVNDFNNPHHNPNITYFDEIVERTYGIYVHMLEDPLSLEEFKIQIVPTVGFIELVQRIVVNRYLYDQVRKWDGSVPTKSFVNLADDWGIQQSRMSPFPVTFKSGLTNETAFIEEGYKDNTSPIPTIADAQGLVSDKRTLPVLFETSSSIPFWFNTTSPPNTAPLRLLNNDLTIRLLVVERPSSAQPLFTLSNDTATLSVVMRPDRFLEVVYNDDVIAVTDEPADEAELEFTLSDSGFYTLDSSAGGQPNITAGIIDDFTPDRFTQVSVNVRPESLFDLRFGLRYLTIYAGLLSPPTYTYVVDDEGRYVVDENGNFVIDLSKPVDEYQDYTDYLYLVDSNGDYIVDREGNRVFELAYVYQYIVDGDGRHLMDDDGSPIRDVDIILSKAYTAMVDSSDDAFLEDTDGSLIVNPF